MKAWRQIWLTGLLVGFGGLAAICRSPAQTLPPPTGEPKVADIAAGYLSFHQITTNAVQVNPELAALCRGASQNEVEAARLQHGPHANAAILIHMNELAERAFTNGSRIYPVGSVIVKRKQLGGFRDSRTGNYVVPVNNGVGGMVKRTAGFDAEHGDWEYFYFENPAKIESGPIAACAQCHQAARATDFVFGNWNHSAKEAKK